MRDGLFRTVMRACAASQRDADDRFRGCADCRIGGDRPTDGARSRGARPSLSSADERTLRAASDVLTRLGRDPSACADALLAHAR